MHAEAIDFFKSLKHKFPQFFRDCRVLDCGSLDINGSLRFLFKDCEYIGVDVRPGKNVDVVSEVRNLSYERESFDVIVSAEMLEHDSSWLQSLKRMAWMLKPGGLLAISCAGHGRPVHGVKDVDGHDWANKPGYYRNIMIDNVTGIINESDFYDVAILYRGDCSDLYIYAIKRP